MTTTLIVGLIMASGVYAYFLYKKRQLSLLKQTYYSEIKAVFEVTKKANKRASEELSSLVGWVNEDLPGIITYKVTTNADFIDLVEKYNLDEKRYLSIFSKISEEITEKITDRFNISTTKVQSIYAEELSKLVSEERKDVSKE